VTSAAASVRKNCKSHYL